MRDVFLHGRDVNGIAYDVERLTNDAPNSAVVMLKIPIAWLREEQTAELATFLLTAAGPDAAREALAKIAPDVFEAAQRYAKAEELSVEQTRLALAHRDKRLAAEARASLAERRLAAVLALTTEELAVIVGRVTHEVLKSDEDDAVADAILDLIRSRATEGAEAPTGAAT